MSELSQSAVELARPFGFPITNSMVVTWVVALANGSELFRTDGQQCNWLRLSMGGGGTTFAQASRAGVIGGEMQTASMMADAEAQMAAGQGQQMMGAA